MNIADIAINSMNNTLSAARSYMSTLNSTTKAFVKFCWLN